MSKFAWSFNKVGYFGKSETKETMKQVWKLIEQSFEMEIEQLKQDRFPKRSATVLAQICFGVEHHNCNEGYGLSERFWKDLNNTIASFARERKRYLDIGNQMKNQIGDEETQTKESIQMIKDCLENQPNLDSTIARQL